MAGEIDTLTKVLYRPKPPLVAIVGGSKLSTKLQLLEALLGKVSQLIVGGGIANTFLKAKGYSIGKSLCEPDWVPKAEALFLKAEQRGVSIPLPEDVVVAKQMTPDAEVTVKGLDEIVEDDCIFDVGPKTAAHYPAWMAQAGTIVWNGPVGVFEIAAFSHGTEAMGQAIAKSLAYSIVGGGDTLAALNKFNITDKMSYISTGGGAFLEFLKGDVLPAIAVLEERARGT